MCPEEEEHFCEQFSHFHHRLIPSFFIQYFDGLLKSITLQPYWPEWQLSYN